MIKMALIIMFTVALQSFTAKIFIKNIAKDSLDLL